MSFEPQLTTEAVVSGIAKPKILHVVTDFFQGEKRVKLDFQQVPQDQLQNDDFFNYLTERKGLPPTPHIGPKLDGLFNSIRSIGGVMGRELVRAFTTDGKKHIYESVNTIPGHAVGVASFSTISRIPEGHSLILEIHNHPPHISGESHEGLSPRDLSNQLPTDKSQKSSWASAVVTSRGAYIALSHLPATRMEQIMGWFHVMTDFQFAPSQYTTPTSPNNLQSIDYINWTIGSIIEREIGPLSGGYWENMTNEQRLNIQKKICQHFGLQLYFVKKDTKVAIKLA